MNKQLLIAGGTGLIGNAIESHAVKNNWDVTLLSRTAGPGRITWQPDHLNIDLTGKMKFDAIINLAGAPIADHRWSQSRKKEIHDSRINSARTLSSYLSDGQLHTNIYLGTSGIGIYGDRGKKQVDESTPIEHKENWLIKTVIDWEKAHNQVAGLGIRTVILRTGIVLSNKGGALQEILQKSGMGVLPYFGNGSQIWPWIHIHDLVNMVFYCIEHQQANGMYIATAPNAASNKNIILAIRKAMTVKKITAGTPRILMSVMLGEMHRVLFDSCDAIPARILREGFQFEFKTIDEAAKDLMVEENFTPAGDH